MATNCKAGEKLATCVRILAMRGLIGLFGHISVYEPEVGRVLISPGKGSDKAAMHCSDLAVLDLSGRALEGQGPVEWPIHTALHASQADALAVAHLHSPYATLFAIAKRKFQPVTLQGSMFLDGIPVYPGAHLITTPALGQEVANLMGSKRAALLRSHGIVVVGRDIEEMLYSVLVFEDNALKAVQAATLGELHFLTAEECQAHEEGSSVQYRARRAWHCFTQMEARWDRQPASGLSPYV